MTYCSSAAVVARSSSRTAHNREASGASGAELQAVLLGTGSIDGFLQELAGLAARALGEGLSCGITLQLTAGR
jgi:hypothetical protein